MNHDDLKKEIVSQEKLIRDLKFGAIGITNKNTKARKDARKTIARAKTQLRSQVV